LYLNLLRSASKEIMLIIPTANTMNHQSDVGVFALLKEIIQDKHNIKNKNKNIDIKILAPLKINDNHYNIYLHQQQQTEHNNMLSSSFISSVPIQIRNIEIDSTTKTIIAIIDNKESLVIE